MTLAEFKQKLSPSECDHLRKGVCHIEQVGQVFYIIYNYDKLINEKKYKYAIQLNVLDPLDALIAAAHD